MPTGANVFRRCIQMNSFISIIDGLTTSWIPNLRFWSNAAGSVRPWSLHYCVPFENFVKFNYSKQKFIIKNQHDTHLLDTGGWNNVSSPLYAPYTFGLPSWAVENHIAGSESSNRSRTCLCTDPMKTNLTRHHLWLLYNLYLRTLSPLLTVQRTPLLRQKCCLLPGCRAVVWICQVRHINGD